MGASDSPQATLIPLNFLADSGLTPRRGLRGRRRSTCSSASTATTSAASATRSARSLRGDADAACMIDANHLAFAREGTHSVRRRRECSPRRPPTITATSRCSTARPPNRSRASGSCCSACRMRDAERAAAARSRRLEALGARPRRAGMRSLPAAVDRFGTIERSSSDSQRSMQVDLGTLGFAEGGYLLVKRALRQAATPDEDDHRHRHGAGPGCRSARLVPRRRTPLRMATGVRDTADAP